MRENEPFTLTCAVLLLCAASVMGAVPFIDAGAPPADPSDEQASILAVLSAWNPDREQYRELSADQKLSLEEFNVLAMLSSKSHVPMTQIWKWRKIKLGWQAIAERAKLHPDDLVPRSEKKWPEPYSKCWSYWREKGDPKAVVSLGDYDIEKMAEVMTLCKYSGKTSDLVVEQFLKGDSFRSLSLKLYLEKNKKPRRK